MTIPHHHAPSRPAPGFELEGRYRFGRQVGSGGMGSVFEARHLYLDRLVAVKVLSGTIRRTPGGAERFLREAQTLSKIQHPNVVRVFDSGRTADGLFYMVMELLEGADLKQYCASFNGPVPWPHACDVLLQLLDGIAAVHAQGVLHRDLKPANTFLARQAGQLVVKLIDFGVAKPVSSNNNRANLTADGLLVGTPDYLAPELLQSSSPATVQSDLYAAGVIAYQMLCGRVPFGGDTILERMNAAVSQPPVPLGHQVHDVPPALDDLVLQMLAKRPEQRPRSAAEAAARMRAVIANDGLTPTSSIPVEVEAESVPTMDLGRPLAGHAAAAAKPQGGVRPWKAVVGTLVGVASFVLAIDTIFEPPVSTLEPVFSNHGQEAFAVGPVDGPAPVETPLPAIEETPTPADAPVEIEIVEPTPAAKTTKSAAPSEPKPAAKTPARPATSRRRPEVAKSGPPADPVLLRRIEKKIAKQCTPTTRQSVSFLVGSNGKPLGVTIRPADASAGCSRKVVSSTLFRTRASSTPFRFEVGS